MRKLLIAISLLLLAGNSNTITYTAPTTLLWTPHLNLTTTSTGTWVDLRYYTSLNVVITVSGAFGAGTGATLYVDFSNTNTGSTVPNAYTHVGIPVGSAINASTVVTYWPTARWAKIRVEGNNTSTVSVSCVARSN